MAAPTVSPEPQTGRRSAAPWVVLGAAVVLGTASVLVPGDGLRLLLAASGLTLACLVMVVALFARRAGDTARDEHARVAEFAGLDGAPCFTTDADGAIRYENPAAVARFGLTGAGPLARALGDLFASPGAVLARLQDRALAGGHAHEDVVTRRGHVRLSVHRIEGGRFFWRLEEFVDRNAATRGAESLGIPMLTVSRTGTVLFMNDAMRRLVGGRVRTLDRIFAYLPIRSGEEVEVAGVDGPVRAIVAEIEEASGRREVYLLPVPPDHPRAQAAFSGFEDLPVALARLSPTGRVLQANHAARELLGIAAGPRGTGADVAIAAMQIDLAQLVEGPGRPVADWLADAMAGRSENRTETLRAGRGSGDGYLQITLRRVVEDARPGLVAVIADATELKSLEAQFVQSQKMQAIGQLAGGIAHDFNNLLTAISGHCDLLLLRRDPGDPDYADLIQVHQNANRAASLVGQLLAFSRKQRQMPEVLDLRDVLGDMTHLLDRLMGERVSLRLDHDPDLPSIRADKRQIEQVLMNLVVNARDAMPEGGEIRIETDYVNLRHAFRRDRVTVPSGAYVRLRVADSGVGIPADVLPRIFEPFFTTKRVGEGTGLGLSTAYGIVKQSGGFIFAESVPGQGSTFVIYLPAGDAPGEPKPAGSQVAPAQPDWSGAVRFDTATGGTRDAHHRDPRAPADGGRAPGPTGAGGDGTPGEDRPQIEAWPVAAAPDPAVSDAQTGAAPQVAVQGPAADAGAEDPGAPEVAAPDLRQSDPGGAGALEGVSRSTDSAAAPPDHDRCTAVILLVEDEASVRVFAARALRHKGHEVIEAESAEAALAALEDPSLGIDLVVSDVVMPGLDGPSWVRQARRHRPDLPVIFMSGYADAALDDDGPATAASVLLPKPFSLEELTLLVERMMAGRG